MRFIILTLILFCQSFTVLSQGPANSIGGVVTDPNGAVIPQAKVTVTLQGKTDPTSTRSFETQTDEEGSFTFKDLSAGNYKLSITATGFGSEVERLISVPQGKRTEIRVELMLGLGCDKISEGSGVVTENDKAEIVRTAFMDAISSNSGLLMREQREGGIIVSTRNIKPEWLNGISNVKVELMSQSQIQQEANHEGDFLYVSFPYFRVKGLCVAVEVANTWAVGKNSKFVYLSGGGNRYEFRKQSGKWVKKSLSGWVS